MRMQLSKGMELKPKELEEAFLEELCTEWTHTTGAGIEAKE